MAKTEGLFTEKAVSQILREDLPFTPNPFKGIMKPFRLFSQVLLLLGLVMVCAAGSSKAAMQIDIYGPGQNIVNLAMAAPLSTGQPAQGLGKELDAAIHDNLSFLPFMRLATSPRTSTSSASSLRARTCSSPPAGLRATSPGPQWSCASMKPFPDSSCSATLTAA